MFDIKGFIISWKGRVFFETHLLAVRGQKTYNR